MLRAQIDNDRASVGGSGIEEVTFRPLSFAEHRTFAKRSHVKDRKGFDMTYFGSTRVVDQASAHSLQLPGSTINSPTIDGWWTPHRNLNTPALSAVNVTVVSWPRLTVKLIS